MSAFSRLASSLRSLPSWAARYIDNRLAAIEDSVAGLASDGTFTMSSAAANKAVYVSAADTVALADADDTAKNSPIGFTVSAPTGSTAVVRFVGIVTGAGTFTAGAVQYLSATAGALTETSPNAPYGIPVAIAINTTDLLILPSGLLATILRGLTTKTGANVVGYDDSGSKTTAASVGDALDELYIEATSALGVIDLSSGWYLLTGAPLAIFADGTTTVPGSDVEGGKAFGVRWNNDAAPAAITRRFVIPPDMDITVNPTFHAGVAKIGATNNAGNTITLDVALYNQVDAALYDADSNFGGTTSAIDPSLATKTQQDVSLAITASNLAAYPASVTIEVKPTAGTLTTDDALLCGGPYIVYKRKPRTS